MTMSTSSAPAATAALTSATLMSRNVWPLGKPVATVATLTLEPRRASFASGIRLGYRQTAATDGIDGSPGCGWMAFAHRARILPGVSRPSSVVRSIIRIARSRAHSFEAFLIERRFRLSTRSSTPTWSTAVWRPSTLPRGPGRPPAQARTSSLARSREIVSGCRTAMGVAGYIPSHDRPADHAAGAAAAEAAGGAAADAGPSPAGALRFDGAPLRADVGWREGARAHRARGDRGRRRGVPDRGGRHPGPRAAGPVRAGDARRRALGGARRRDRGRRRRRDARPQGAGPTAHRRERPAAVLPRLRPAPPRRPEPPQPHPGQTAPAAAPGPATG